MHGQPIPESFMKGKRFAFMDTFSKERPKLLGTQRKFAQHGKSGAWVSECLPHFAKIVDDVSFVRTMATERLQSRAGQSVHQHRLAPVRPAGMGAWVTYGIGSESTDLPGFVVLQSGPRGPRGGSALWSSGFLPTTYQGVPFRSGGDPILNLSSPAGISPRRQERRDRRRQRPEQLTASTTPATRKSPRASPPTRWPIACSPALRS